MKQESIVVKKRKNYNKSIEWQLDLLSEFWKEKDKTNAKWQKNEKIQEEYYNYLKKENFVSGEANKKDNGR